ncbi:hypothetical protein PInf_009320 [Phytophthora infestans]|nr:hypothetical protein PInf_009320 [Phytophthora infestans]
MGILEALQEYILDDITVEDLVEDWERLAGDDNGVQTGGEVAWVADEDDGAQTDEDHTWIAGDKAELGGDTNGAQGRCRNDHGEQCCAAEVQIRATEAAQLIIGGEQPCHTYLPRGVNALHKETRADVQSTP